jgi:type 1 fimbriae regulatory protein FimE
MRDYLRPDEVEAMVQAARKSGRHRVRDAAIILLMFRHGLRTAELVSLRWQQVDLKAGYLDVYRVKCGHDAKHPLRGPQLRLLRELQRTYPDSPYVFVSERKAPLSPRSIREIVARVGKVAGLPFVPHPHQLRHACGYYLASCGHDTRAIQDYLGHKNMVVLENSNVAKLVSTQYLSVHSLPQEDCYDTDDASAREIYPILVPESTMSTVQSSRRRQHRASVVDRDTQAHRTAALYGMRPGVL